MGDSYQDYIMYIVTVVGCEGDVQDLIGTQGDAKQLATWCAVLKKELTTKRQETRTLKEQTDKLKKELVYTKRTHKQIADELTACRDHLKVNEEDLSNLETQNTHLKKKIDDLSKAMGSPHSRAENFAHRLLHESPAPMGPPNKRPKLTLPGGIDLDLSGDLFNTSNIDVSSVASPSVQTKKDCKQYGTHYLKISSAATTANSTKTVRKEVTDISNIPITLSGLNIFKKKGLLSDGSSLIKQGYNGLGSHERFIQPSGRPRPTAAKKTKSTYKYTMPKVTTSTDKPPPLPSLFMAP